MMMSELNPYAPPQSDVTPQIFPGAMPLASPWIRLAAQIVDGIIAVILITPIMFLTGYFGRVATSGGALNFEDILWVPLQLAIIVAINWTFLLNGQTIGKKLLKIRIVRKDGSPIERARIITHRILPVWLIGSIPFINFALLADAICIFRPGRNTLHDDFADTKVVVAEI
jgi:uncharacterized RDD family membrane protein YckC